MREYPHISPLFLCAATRPISYIRSPCLGILSVLGRPRRAVIGRSAISSALPGLTVPGSRPIIRLRWWTCRRDLRPSFPSARSKGLFRRAHYSG
jgi:hypothetical protein